jgi:hypothetical protein
MLACSYKTHLSSTFTPCPDPVCPYIAPTVSEEAVEHLLEGQGPARYVAYMATNCVCYSWGRAPQAVV